MATRLKLTVTYKNGTEISNLVNYLHFEDGAIFYTVDKQVHEIIEQPVKIQMENIKRFDLEQVEMEGWK